MTVTVTVASGGDVELLTLMETGGSTGVFTGVLDTSGVAGDASDGVLNGCETGATLTAVYTDAQPSIIVTATLFLGREAGSVVVPSAYQTFTAEEGVVTITVQDADLNTDPYEAETYDVSLGLVQVTTAGDTEQVSLSETARDTGVFTGVITTTLASVMPNNGALSVVANPSAGSIVTVTYVDASPNGAVYSQLCRTWGQDHACNIGYLRAAHNGSLLLSHTGTARIGESLDVTLLDGDLNQDVTVSESASVTVTSSAGGSVTLTLLETAGNSGVFTATADVAYSGTFSPSLLVNTKNSNP